MSSNESVRRVALFIGAHPDDIELGAGGTAANLLREGWDVTFAVLTSQEDDQSAAQQRRTEAAAAARVIGLQGSRIVFLNLPDGRLECDGGTVELLRSTLRKKNVDPDVVFTHSPADSHNDHRAAHEITLSAFRRKPILCYEVLTSLVQSEFKPKVYANISDSVDTKMGALAAHRSQTHRFDAASVRKHVNDLSLVVGFAAEAFELKLQEGAGEKAKLVWALNACPFNNFWSAVIDDDKLVIIHAVPVMRRKPALTGVWPADLDREGITLLRRAFRDMWHGGDPIEDYSCATSTIENCLWQNNVVLSGGAVSNSLTRDYFNHLAGIRYRIEYEMPDYTDIHIFDSKRNRRTRATYRKNDLGNTVLQKDVGILTVMQNPMAPGKQLFGCMGIHGYGTLGCYGVLSTRALLREFTDKTDLLRTRQGCQVLVEYDIATEKPNVMWSSLHRLERRQDVQRQET